MLKWQLHSRGQRAVVIHAKICEEAPLVADGAKRWSKFFPNWRREQVKKVVIAQCTNCGSYFYCRFPSLLAHTSLLEKKNKTKKPAKQSYLVINMSGAKAQPSAQRDQTSFRITNWNNLFSRFCHLWECSNGTFHMAGLCNTSVGFGTILRLSWTQ